MIDWVGLAFGAMWVTGLALALTVASFASWEARQRGVRLRQLLGEPRFVVPMELGGTLFAIGLSYGAHPWWQVVLWVLVAAAFAYDAVAVYRLSR